MVGSIQNGIFYEKGKKPGRSLGIIFLKYANDIDAQTAGISLLKLWNMYSGLNGDDAGEYSQNPVSPMNGLSTLIGYNRRTFSLPGALKSEPKDLIGINFKEPNGSSKTEVLEGSSLFYDEKITINPALNDDIVIQLIANDEFSINLAIAETWRKLLEINKNKSKIYLDRFYTGYGRSDNKSLLGFYDGVSNIESDARKYAIAIPPSSADKIDDWTINGTYLMYMKIGIDLEEWWKLRVDEQEAMVGSDKKTGCPLVGMDMNGKPLKDPRCPVLGTSNILQEGNESFRNHPSYNSNKNSNDLGFEELKYSHIGTMRKNLDQPPWSPYSYRIFRQGYEFIEPTEAYPKIKCGLHFISFQNSAVRIAKTTAAWNSGVYYQGGKKSFNDFLSVLSAGFYFVPPIEKSDSFPGSSIFFDSKQVNSTYPKQNNYVDDH